MGVNRFEARRVFIAAGSPWVGIVATLLATALAPSLVGGQEPGGYENLQVLPADISRGELTEIMLQNMADLGLPRRANEGCLFCHVGSMDTPVSQWEWASDANPMKDKARAMMAMVAEINGEWLAGIERSTETDVSCYTCHAARTNPQPLPELLRARHAEGGVNDLIETYRSVRSRYYAADAYDFRVPVLAEVADALFATGEFADAVRVHELNIEYGDDPTAHHGLIRLRLRTTLAADGIDAMVARYHSLKAQHPETAFSPILLTVLGWDLFRSGSEEAGFRLFELNYAEHPDAYSATEDLAWGSVATGDHARGLALAEAWVERNPDHELGLRLLADIRGSGD